MFKRSNVLTNLLTTIFILLVAMSNSTFAADTKASSEHYENALDEFEKEDIEASYIHLKNSLQADPDYLPAKILMGRVLMVSGYLKEAEIEFQEALSAEADPNLVVDPLGKTWLFLEKYDEITSANFTGLDDENRVNWQIIVATANSNMEKYDLARQQYQLALKIAPTHVRTLNALASLEKSLGHYSEAEKYLQRSFAVDGRNANTWQIKGEMHLNQADVSSAISALEQGFEIDPQDPLIVRSLVSAYLKNNEKEKAKDMLEKVLKQTPDDPTAGLLKAWLLATSNQTGEATVELEKLSSNLAGATQEMLDAKPDLLYIGALSAFAQSKYEQARTYFTQYLTLFPENIEAVNLLAQTHVKLNQRKIALEVMQRHERELSKNLDSALLLGELYLANNKAFKTLELLYKLKQKYPDNKRIELLEIKTLIARDKFEDAFDQLDSSDYINSDISFILTKSLLLLETGQLERANNVADRLLELSNNTIDFLNFKAAVLIKMRRWKEAEPFVDRVLEINPNHYSGRYNRATLHNIKNQHEQAFAIIEKLHEEQPENLSTLIVLARTQSELGQQDIAIKNLQKVLERDIGNRPAGELYSTLLIGMNQLDKGLAQLNKLIKNNPEVAKYQLQRADVYYAKQQLDRVKRELKKIAELVSEDPSGLLELSKMQLKMSLPEDAQKSIGAASALLPTSRYLASEYIRIHVVTGDFDSAEKKLEGLKANLKDDPELKVLEGDIMLARGQKESASEQYMQAYQLAPNYRLALAKFYQLTLQDIGKDQFTKIVSETLEKAPEDHFKRNLLADHFLNQGQFKKALPHYEKLVQVEDLANKSFIYNNLANILLSSDLGKAKMYAEQAMSSGAINAAIVDTHGWIKALSGNFGEALTILRRAYAMDSNDPAIRYHLAYTLHKMGRPTEAKDELNAALASQQPFIERDDAEALLNSI